MHCRFVLEKLLTPLCEKRYVKTTTPCKQAVVLIENRIDEQWLFTVLNTWLMCPKDSEFALIVDKKSVVRAKDLLNRYAPSLKSIILDVDEIAPGTHLEEHTSFNAMLKRPEFWSFMPYEKLLVIQTDALLAKPLHPFFLNFSYLGAPFLPRQHSEYFTLRDANGHINRFFKTDSPIHGSPDRDVYPHLHGNGGLSIRSNRDARNLQSLGDIQPKRRSRRRLFQPSYHQDQHTSTARYSTSFCDRNDLQS